MNVSVDLQNGKCKKELKKKPINDILKEIKLHNDIKLETTNIKRLLACKNINPRNKPDNTPPFVIIYSLKYSALDNIDTYSYSSPDTEGPQTEPGSPTSVAENLAGGNISRRRKRIRCSSKTKRRKRPYSRRNARRHTLARRSRR